MHIHRGKHRQTHTHTHTGIDEAPWRAPRNVVEKMLAACLNWRSTSLGVAGCEVCGVEKEKALLASLGTFPVSGSCVGMISDILITIRD
jgi:hypothetical protein